jgi:hypothetical protein
MAGADLHGRWRGASTGRARRCSRVAGRLEADWRWRRSDWRWQMPESESTRPPRRLLPYALAGSVDPKGVNNDRELEGGGHATSNIGSVAAQVCEIIERAYVLVTRATEGGRQRKTQSLQAGGLLDHNFRLKCILNNICWLKNLYTRGLLGCAPGHGQVARGPNPPLPWP